VKSYHKGSSGYVTMFEASEVEVSPGYKESFLKVWG
jgi:two-component system LytT family response regulator